jgi:hypothetical protein
MANNHEQALIKFGYRCGRSGAHASRTMMLDDVSALLAHVQPTAAPCDYRREVVDSNTLGKPTRKARELTFRHLVALYGLDPGLAVFRVFRQLWHLDEEARPVLALMVALVRDPLLRLSRDFMLAKHPGESVRRDELEVLLAKDDTDRFTSASLKSFAQNINGTWTQAGFLVGRRHKTRVVPRITPTNVTFALFLGYLEGLTGERLFASQWMNLLPGSPDELVLHANAAANRGQIVFMNAGGVKEVRFPGYLSSEEEMLLHE